MVREEATSGPADADSGAMWSAAACAETARRIGDERWTMLRLVYLRGLTQREVARQLHLRTDLVRREIADALRVMADVVTGEFG